MSVFPVQETINIGVAVENERYCLAMCESGKATHRREFAVDAGGRSSLANYIAGFEMPARIAIGAATPATIAMAVALSAIPQSEIFLVSPSVAAQSVELARYAERSL